MDNELIKRLDSKKKDLILNIYENNFDSSTDKTILCKNSINCIDISCFKSHYVDFNNRELINNIIEHKNEIEEIKENLSEIEEIEEINEIEEIEWKVDNEESIEKQLTKLSNEIKENLSEIKKIEEYLKILHIKLNEKKIKAKVITKELLKLI